MASERYLAMTAAEFAGCSSLPPKLCWMACHFSPYSTGLSNLPGELPPDSLLILNDRTPIHGHDPNVIAKQLKDAAEDLHCRGVLLDFQRRENEETKAVVATVLEALSCPVAVSDGYAKDFTCPVFVSPVPPHVPLAEHLAPWQGREIWLELALSAEILTLTESGAVILPLALEDLPDNSFQEKTLHCHYAVEIEEKCARFTLWRTKEDLDTLAWAAENAGVSTFAGLYQELK